MKNWIEDLLLDSTCCAATPRVSPAEFKRVSEARRDMEPTPLHMAEVRLAKEIPGITNSITTSLGLGNFF